MTDLLLILFAAAMLVASGMNVAAIVRRERRLRELRRAIEMAGKR